MDRAVSRKHGPFVRLLVNFVLNTCMVRYAYLGEWVLVDTSNTFRVLLPCAGVGSEGGAGYSGRALLDAAAIPGPVRGGRGKARRCRIAAQESGAAKGRSNTDSWYTL